MAPNSLWVVTMDYKESINYRRSIERKVFSSEKLTGEDKRWLESNPRFNEKFDFPCYQRDVLRIPKKAETVITITPICYNDKTKIYRPVISIIGKGVIKVNSQLFDLDRKEVAYKETRVLIPLFDEKTSSISVTVVSDSGLINVEYQCEYYDELTRLHKREFSNGANLFFGMKKQTISDNEFLYHCKSPDVLVNNFDSFAFSIKITK